MALELLAHKPISSHQKSRFSSPALGIEYFPKNVQAGARHDKARKIEPDTDRAHQFR